MQKTIKKTISIVLSLVILLSVFGGMTFTASAAANGKALQLVNNGVADNILGNKQSTVWFGNYFSDVGGSSAPISWITLRNQNKQLFLLSQANLDYQPYDSSGEQVGNWIFSSLFDWLNSSFYDVAFSTEEKRVIPTTSAPHIGEVFVLDREEAQIYDVGGTNFNGIVQYNCSLLDEWTYTERDNHARGWWLRDLAGMYMNYDGSIVTDASLSDKHPVRPATNLRLDSVLFTSAAENGKQGEGALAEIANYTGREWKFTLKDYSRSGFSVSETSYTVCPQDSVSLNYSGAKTGDNEWISAMIVNSSGDAVYYGRLVQPTNADGTLTVDLPALTPGSYTLKVFNEQYNGDKKSDYASDFANVSLTVKEHTHRYSYVKPTWRYTDKYFETVTLNVNDGNIILDSTGYRIGAAGTHVSKNNAITQYVITGTASGLRDWLTIHNGETSATTYNVCFQDLNVRDGSTGVSVYGSGATVNLMLRGKNAVWDTSTKALHTEADIDSFATVRIAAERGSVTRFFSEEGIAPAQIIFQQVGNAEFSVYDQTYTSFSFSETDFSSVYLTESIMLEIRGFNHAQNPFETGKPAVTATFFCSCGATQVVPDLDPKTVTVNSAGCITNRVIKHTGSVTFDGMTYTGQTEPEEVPNTALGHVYGQPDWSFAEDGNVATASFTCTRCGNDTQTVTDNSPTSAQVSAATCAKDQYVKYYGRVTFKDKTYDGESEPIAVSGTAFGHSYGAPVWSWSEDYGSVTAAFFCERGDDMQTVTDDDPVITVVTAPDCVTDQTAICTGAVTFNDEVYTTETQVVTVPGTALGHSYGAPVWTWADDHSSAAASFTCAVCGSDTQTVTDPSPVQTEVTPAGCLTDQEVKYVGTVTFNDKTYTGETEAFSVPGTALGHCYGEPVWSFAEDGSAATARFTCVRCTADTQTVTDSAPVRSEVSAATCIENQTVRYTASVTFEDTVYTGESKNIPVPGTALGHRYGEPVWIWDDDYELATAIFTCSVCGKGQQTMIDPAPTAEEYDPATETTDQLLIYTAAIRFNGTVYTDMTDPVPVPGTSGKTDVPDTPGTTDTENLCPWDHVDHGKTVFGRIIRLFHTILYYISNLF